MYDESDLNLDKVALREAVQSGLRHGVRQPILQARC